MEQGSRTMKVTEHVGSSSRRDQKSNEVPVVWDGVPVESVSVSICDAVRIPMGRVCLSIRRALNANSVFFLKYGIEFEKRSGLRRRQTFFFCQPLILPRNAWRRRRWNWWSDRHQRTTPDFLSTRYTSTFFF